MARLVVQHQNQPSFSLLPSSLSDFNGIRLTNHIQCRRKVCQPKGALHVTASGEKKILMMGGTRFIGVFLARLLVKEGHQVTLFTRGKAAITQQLPGESDKDYAEFSSKVLHLKGDRKDFEFVKTSLAAEGFDVVYDINGVCNVLDISLLSMRDTFCFLLSRREAVEIEPILDALPNLQQLDVCVSNLRFLPNLRYIYCSSAGVYKKSDLLPHCELTQRAGTRGKLETESLLDSRGRPIPIPNSGIQITQLGHVKVSETAIPVSQDGTTPSHTEVLRVSLMWFNSNTSQDLAKAFLLVLSNEKASKQVFNISGEKYVTFDGLARACAKGAGFPEPEIVHYNPKEFDFGKKKAFPFRDQHFFASIEKAKSVLGWKPEFDLVEGLADSYNLDFGRGTFRKEADFSTDDIILERV
ncbi:Chloroplast stem-loop binding protein of 41 kDa b, chloroplastic [Vitis vinifera]|uniref:Chloroplast stem-loop binding protein of 41 kDa b, chloroplastic n=1 Tax=Vitis vinifera TaxID=29760 RepID=A0A438IMK9_VITVI|nr:Chloroplast stem-loop binding protein of 41 kDa b, chloroplastic [Vitis vinifera]